MTYIVQYRVGSQWHDYTTRLSRRAARRVWLAATKRSVLWRDGWRYRIVHVDEDKDTRRVEQESP